jgi:AraC-like DNA-binding protein
VRLSPNRRVIIVGPPELAAPLARKTDHVMQFRTLEELDRWREQQTGEAIGADVIAALHELEMAFDAIPEKLRSVLESIAMETRVPALRELEQHWSSRRSFYRTWNDVFDEPPSMFLRRVRSLHAQRLLTLGFTRKQAAMLAGYSSVDQMRRNSRL